MKRVTIYSDAVTSATISTNENFDPVRLSDKGWTTIVDTDGVSRHINISNVFAITVEEIDVEADEGALEKTREAFRSIA